MARKREAHEFDQVATALLNEVDELSTRVAGALFAQPGPDSRKMTRQDYVDLTRRLWDNPPPGPNGGPSTWRMDLLDRLAPKGADGGRPEFGLHAFNALLNAAFPDGRPPDPPPPPQPPPFAVPPNADEAAGAPSAAPGQEVVRGLGSQVADAHQDAMAGAQPGGPPPPPGAGPGGPPQGMMMPAGGQPAGPSPAGPQPVLRPPPPPPSPMPPPMGPG